MHPIIKMFLPFVIAFAPVTPPPPASVPHHLDYHALLIIACDPARETQFNDVTLAGPATITASTFYDVAPGMRGTLVIHQDAAGGRTLTVPANSKIAAEDSAGPSYVRLTYTPNATDVVEWFYDGTTFHWWIHRNML